MAIIQLDLFKSADECEMDALRAEIKKLHTSYEDFLSWADYRPEDFE